MAGGMQNLETQYGQFMGIGDESMDLNNDGVVNWLDAMIATQQYSDVVALMVQREILGQNTYDINGDGIVNLADIMTAQQAGAPEGVIQAIVN